MKKPEIFPCGVKFLSRVIHDCLSNCPNSKKIPCPKKFLLCTWIIKFSSFVNLEALFYPQILLTMKLEKCLNPNSWDTLKQIMLYLCYCKYDCLWKLSRRVGFWFTCTYALCKRECFKKIESELHLLILILAYF